VILFILSEQAHHHYVLHSDFSVCKKDSLSCALEINCDCFQFCTDFFPALHSFPFILRYFIESENVGNTHLRVDPTYFLVAHVKDPKASY